MSHNEKIKQDISIFLNQWDIYQHVVNKNCMAHQQIEQHLHEFILKEYSQQHFSLLDLGCGDASVMASILKDTHIDAYLGVDLSEAALALAADNHRNLSFNSDFCVGDLKSFTETIHDQTFDIIVAGFSLHHLLKEEKQQFFRDCQSTLNHKGVLLIYDVIRYHDESRSEYLKRYCAQVHSLWCGLDDDSIEVINGHITSSDHPESLQTLEEMTQTSGFKSFSVLYQDSTEFHQLLAIR